ncbi:hypothetical protein HKBW3S42_00611, partial [Candidatus Hakubella thermalkaliphila]
KKTPTLTLPQVQRLLAAALERERLDRRQAAQILKYYTYRNYGAYMAHSRRRKVNRLDC